MIRNPDPHRVLQIIPTCPIFFTQCHYVQFSKLYTFTRYLVHAIRIGTFCQHSFNIYFNPFSAVKIHVQTKRGYEAALFIRSKKE